MKILALLAFLTCVCLNAFAQEDIYECQFYGFSDDLKYCAFEMFRASGGEGYPNESKIYFIDVDKNDFAMKPIAHADNEANPISVEQNRVANKKQAEIYFTQFKIKGGKLGTPVDLAIDTEDYRKPALPDQSFTVRSDKYVVHLVTVSTGETDENERTKAMFEVQLEKNGVNRVLQKAIPIPKSWGFVYEYEIKSIFYLNNKIAVFVEYHSPGFEGAPNRNQMIVTGNL